MSCSLLANTLFWLHFSHKEGTSINTLWLKLVLRVNNRSFFHTMNKTDLCFCSCSSSCDGCAGAAVFNSVILCVDSRVVELVLKVLQFQPCRERRTTADENVLMCRSS